MRTTEAGDAMIRAFPMARLPIARSKAIFGAPGTDLVDLVFYSWLIRTEDAMVLVDTGLPPAGQDRDALVLGNAAVDPRELFADIRTLDEAYSAWGITPEQIDHVVITQTITYHTGNLLGASLPRAQVHMALPGLIELLTQNVGHPARHLYFTPDSWTFLLATAIDGRLHPVAQRSPVTRGVDVIVTGGHHPGSAAVTVNTSHGSVCLLETAFITDNISSDTPIGVAENAALARSVTRHAVRDHDTVLAIHDPSHAQTYP